LERFARAIPAQGGVAGLSVVGEGMDAGRFGSRGNIGNDKEAVLTEIGQIFKRLESKKKRLAIQNRTRIIILTYTMPSGRKTAFVRFGSRADIIIMKCDV
jgi:hypothetical protein